MKIAPAPAAVTQPKTEVPDPPPLDAPAEAPPVTPAPALSSILPPLSQFGGIYAGYPLLSGLKFPLLGTGLAGNTAAQLDNEIAESQNKQNTIRRSWPVVLIFALVLLGVSGVLYGVFRMDRLPLAIVGAVIVAALGYFVYRTQALTSAENKLRTLEAKRKTAEEQRKASSVLTKPATIPEDRLKFLQLDAIVDLNVRNLASYYPLVARHAGRSFATSLGGGVLGFVLIVTGLVFAYIDQANAKTLSFIASGSGVVTEFISAVFFYLYNRTVRQMKEYHDSLVFVQNVLLSIKLVSDIERGEGREKMIGEMLGYVLGGGKNAPRRPAKEEASPAK